jgi:hypothetical protein
MHIWRGIVVSALSLSISIPALAQTLSGATTKSPEELTQEGRLVVGRGVDYTPSDEDEKTLADKLKTSMLERRNFAWHVVEEMLQPTKVKLPDNDQMVDVPRWETWYEGMGAQELNDVIDIYFHKLKANPNADRALLANETLDDQAKRSLAPALTDARFTGTLKQFEKILGFPAEFVERGFTAFSPSFVVHMLTNAEAIEKCKRNMPADQAQVGLEA